MTFDWATLAFQAINVTILIWLLSRVFWRPMSEMIGRRKEAIETFRTEAETALKQAEETRAGLAAERVGIGAEREAALDTARAEAEALRQELLSKAKAEANKLRKAAQDSIAAERAATEAAYAACATNLSVEMASRIGRQMDGPALRAAALDAVVREIAALPETDREVMNHGTTLTVATSTELSRAEREAVGTALTEALGTRPEMDFRADQDLVAGLEVASPHLTVGHTWRDGLERMRQEIADGQR